MSDTNGTSELANAEQLVAHISATAEHEAMRHVGNDLAGVLFSREQAATDPEVIEALRSERREVQARIETIAPASDEVSATLEAWAARLRALQAR